MHIKRRIIENSANESSEHLIDQLFEHFKKVFAADLTIESFADMYAQTVTCGLFSARLMRKKELKIEENIFMIPEAVPFLKNFLNHLRNPKNSRLDLKDLGIADLVHMLNKWSVEAILEELRKEMKENDSIIHFYELFLKEYDAGQRIQRGVFYTPNPVVSFIVRSVHHILQVEFGLPDGFINQSLILSEQGKKIPHIQILDPAMGTGAFLQSFIQEMKSAFDVKHGHLPKFQLKKKWNEFVTKHLLTRLSGFELMITPYVIAHMRLTFLLKTTGYRFSERNQLQIYRRNTLQEPHDDWYAKDIPIGIFADFVNVQTEAPRKIAAIRKANPVVVIVGNPPYSVSSKNKGFWISGLIEDYKMDLEEKKINLDDDFIKFIRYGQWQIDQAGKGILALITNNSFIDGLTHRMMRKSLLKSFDKIYILDLHGNAMKQEKTPGGGRDVNVFDIQQGVCISFFIKTGAAGDHEVFHSDLFGNRKEKYRFLSNSVINAVCWTKLHPIEPYFFFVPKNFSLKEEYCSNLRLNKVFRQRSYGIQTKRDKITICFEKEALKAIIFDFINLPERELRKKYNLPPDGRDWKISWAKAELARLGWTPELVTMIQYRPFDYRYTYYCSKTKTFIAYPRYETMNHMLFENVGLIGMRQVFQDAAYSHFGVTSAVIDERTFYSNRGGTYLFPLYCYENKEVKANFSEDFVELVESRTGFQVAEQGDVESSISPRNLFDYMYAIFHSEQYRKRYSEFLKIDFPRVPVTSNKELFLYLCRLGERLVSLHLMTSEKTRNFVSKFEGEGSNVVEIIPQKTKPLPFNEQGKGVIRINKTQFFSRVPQDVWQFNIGGYQVCYKWLRDRKGRKLTEAEILHYQKIITIIYHSISIMGVIDRVIAEKSGWPLR
ncbi:MAG: type ISP restriction/modification enzyme [Candidatus Hodarchaeota archaeon]